jgi:transcriptional regulator GlxA family with amidase domain
MPPTQPPDLLRRLLRARDRMDAASHEAWPVPRLARVSGVSPAHFSRSFKEAFGVPPHRYLLSRRIERARALLCDTTLPVSDIALRAGWRSLGSFSRTYRAVTGESPSATRAAHHGTDHPQDAAAAAIPACFIKASSRPPLTSAVLEKQRQEASTTGPSPNPEDP